MDRLAFMRMLIAAPLFCASSYAVAQDGAADSCKVCHRDSLDLSERSGDELLEAISEIIDGDAAHPIPMPELSEEDLRALADALTN